MKESEKNKLLKAGWSIQVDLFTKIKALCRAKSMAERIKICGEISAIKNTVLVLQKELSSNPPTDSTPSK